MNHKILAIIPSVILFLSSFFVVYFIQNPQDLPFSFEIFKLISQITSVALAIPMLYGLGIWLDWKRDWWKLGLVFLYPLLIESIAIVTKFPYSGFEYGEVLGNIKIFGLVPWTVSLSWTPIFFLSLMIVIRLKLQSWQKWLVLACLMTGFDLVLDPGATTLGFWIWDNPGWYYGVPLMNFFGWMVTSILAAILWDRLYTQLPPLSSQMKYWISLSGVWSFVFWIGISFCLVYYRLVIGVAMSLVLLTKYYNRV